MLKVSTSGFSLPGNQVANFCWRDAADGGVGVQMLLNRDRLPHRVELRAVAQLLDKKDNLEDTDKISIIFL